MSTRKNRWLSRYACGVLSLTIAPAASADFVGLVTVINDNPNAAALCNRAGGANVPDPLTVCSVFAVFDQPTDRVLSVGNADITTTDADGFFQHPAGTDVPYDCSLLTEFPDLICDSYVTIGNVCDGPDQPAGPDCTSPDGDFDSVGFNENGHVLGGWFRCNPANQQGRAGIWPGLAVRVAQLSMNEGQSVSGTLTLFWLEMGTVIVEADLFLECPGPVECPADFDGSGNVGAADLALLLGSWGPCEGCPADLDGNGQVGPFDLALLLGAWGECG